MNGKEILTVQFYPCFLLLTSFNHDVNVFNFYTLAKILWLHMLHEKEPVGMFYNITR